MFVEGWLHSLSLRFRSAKSRRHWQQSRGKPLRRLWLELLEDRPVLAVFTMTNTSASSPGSIEAWHASL